SAMRMRGGEENLLRLELETRLQSSTDIFVDALRNSEGVTGEDERATTLRILDCQHLDPKWHFLAFRWFGSTGIATEPHWLVGRDLSFGHAGFPASLRTIAPGSGQ